MDPNNPIVKLCSEGIAAEGQGRHAEAAALYCQAWANHQDDYEACIAAHYLARQQETLLESLAWNQRALDHALAVNSQEFSQGINEEIKGFLPSLYLNLGWSHEVLEDVQRVRRCYQEGAAHLAALPDGPYTDVVRDGITRGLERTQTASCVPGKAETEARPETHP